MKTVFEYQSAKNAAKFKFPTVDKSEEELEIFDAKKQVKRG